MSMVSGIQGQLLEVTVVGCSRLKDTEWISRQDPYVCLEYATTKFRTRTCTDGGKHPVFQEKTTIPLIEGLREMLVTVWNSNTLTFDDFIGTGRVQLQKVLSQGYDDSSWTIQSKSGKFAGEVKLILHFSNAHVQRPAASYPSASPMYPASYASSAPMYTSAASYSSASPMYMGTPPLGYPPSKSVAMDPPVGFPPSKSTIGYPQLEPVAPDPPYPQPVEAYPPPPASSFPYPEALPYIPPHNPNAFSQPTSTYPPMHYPPQQQTYPPPSYPPQAYPPPPQPESYYPQGSYPGIYPPPPRQY